MARALVQVNAIRGFVAQLTQAERFELVRHLSGRTFALTLQWWERRYPRPELYKEAWLFQDGSIYLRSGEP